MSAGKCPAHSPESGVPCALPDTAEAHYKGHESKPSDLTVVWAKTVDDVTRWTASDARPPSDEWPCDNYLPPLTCFTAPSTETGRCDQCRARPPSDTGTTGWHQVWCIVYDSDTPNMDGSHNAVRMHEVRSLESVQAALQIVRERSTRSPKRNLRIETRWVSDYTLAGQGQP